MLLIKITPFFFVCISSFSPFSNTFILISLIKFRLFTDNLGIIRHTIAHKAIYSYSPLYSAPQCVSLLGIITMKPNRPFLPGSLRCTANVSPFNKGCTGS